METTQTKDYGFKYSFAGKAAFERKTKRLADKLFQDSIIDGNISSFGIQDFYYIMTFHQNKGVVAPEDIEIADDEIDEVTKQIFEELNRWIQHRNKVLENRTNVSS